MPFISRRLIWWNRGWWLGGLAEFERELIRARTGEGHDRAKAQGVRIGQAEAYRSPEARGDQARSWRRDACGDWLDDFKAFNMTARNTVLHNPQAIKELRTRIASVISDEKAYNVPGVCVRYGLADGTGDEAYQSKFKYVSSRVQNLTAEKVIEVAEALYRDMPDFSLGEALAKIGENGQALVTELTRRRIVNTLEHVPFSVRISELEFLQKLWPLDSMRAPASYTKGGTMIDFINLQLFVHDGKANRSILEGLDIYAVSQAQFFKVLEALTDPLAREIPEQMDIVTRLNVVLAADQFHLKEVGRVSGSPRFKVQPLPADTTPADDEITKTLAAFSAPDVHERWQEALKRRASDPRAAITSARTLLEDTCKWILHQADVDFKQDEDLPALYRRLAKLLKLAPDDHTEEIFKQILGNCQSIVTSIGAIRNKLGDAHSQGPKRARPLPRHAELTVNLAGGMATFLIATWEAKQATEAETTKAAS
jgi:AbiJ N-terminal domain 3/Abortive infection C-terminus